MLIYIKIVKQLLQIQLSKKKKSIDYHFKSAQKKIKKRILRHFPFCVVAVAAATETNMAAAEKATKDRLLSVLDDLEVLSR